MVNPNELKSSSKEEELQRPPIDDENGGDRASMYHPLTSLNVDDLHTMLTSTGTTAPLSLSSLLSAEEECLEIIDHALWITSDSYFPITSSTTAAAAAASSSSGSDKKKKNLAKKQGKE